VVDVAQRVTGTVRVDVRTETVEELARASLSRTDVTVDRRDVDRMLDPGEDPPRVRTKDGVTIVPILEERLVVETRLFLKAELHIATTTLTEEVETPVTLRRQRAEVTRSPAAEQADPHSPQPGEN
jgi:stress response protein YsnF